MLSAVKTSPRWSAVKVLAVLQLYGMSSASLHTAHASPNHARRHSPLIMVDFDGTITTEDTVRFLGKWATTVNNNTKPWSYFSDAYIEDYHRHQNSFPENDLPDLEAFVQQLDMFRPVEIASINRISNCKIFAGFTQDALANEGRKLSKELLQPGVIDALRKAKHSLEIVSLNWSKDWIASFIEPLRLSHDKIHSNDLEFRNGITTGEINANIVTSMDKMKEIEAIASLYPTNTPTVFIGDSMGDILPLVKCNVGIIIGKDPKLLSVLRRYGVSVQEGLDSIKLKRARTVYRVDSWNQISASGILSQPLEYSV